MSVPNARAERPPICQAEAEFLVMSVNNEAEYVRTPIHFTELSTRFLTGEFTYEWNKITIRITSQDSVNKVCQHFQLWKQTHAGEDFVLTARKVAPVMPLLSPIC
jgi:hypothetical protein